MPLFYFDVRDGEQFFHDDVGLELPELEQAREHAALALADMAKDVLPDGLKREMAIEVRDESKEPLLQTTLKFEVRRLR
jgi:SHS2 domain-containing protein